MVGCIWIKILHESGVDESENYRCTSGKNVGNFRTKGWLDVMGRSWLGWGLQPWIWTKFKQSVVWLVVGFLLFDGIWKELVELNGNIMRSVTTTMKSRTGAFAMEKSSTYMCMLVLEVHITNERGYASYSLVNYFVLVTHIAYWKIYNKKIVRL